MNRNVARHCLGRARLTAGAVSLLFLMSFTPGLHAAKVPVLMVLQYSAAGQTIQTNIEVQAGLVVSPDKGKPQEKWLILPGDAIQSDSPPDEHAVGFYQGGGGTSTLLFIIKVRYYRNSSGLWVPQFQLDEEPLVARIDGRWQPLVTIHGAPSLIVQTGTALPNAEGYSPSLEIGFTTGATSIDGWIVQ